MVAVTKSRVDPFDPSAIGARVGDEFSTRSTTYQSKAFINLVLSTAGSCGSRYIFCPGMPYGDYFTAVHSAGSSTNASVRSASDSGLATWLDDQEKIRLVSAGVRYHPGGVSTVAAQLAVTVELFDVTSEFGNINPTNLTSSYGSNGQFVFNNKPFTWIARPVSSAAYDFVETSAYTTSADLGDLWTSLMHQINYKLTADNCGYFEIVANWEGIPETGGAKNNNSGSRIIPPVVQDKIQNAVDHARQNLPPFQAGNHDDALTTVSKHIEDGVTNAIDGGIGWLGKIASNYISSFFGF